MIPGFALWNEKEQRYVLRFYPPLAMTGDALRDTQTLQSKLEEVIREYPDQWLWIHRRWKTRPPGEASLYETHVRRKVRKCCSILKRDPAPMNRLERSPLHGSVVALAMTAVALLVSLLLRPYLEPDVFLLFLVAVWLSAWYYGRTVGLVATGASAVALLCFFFPAAARVRPVGVRLGSFLVIACVISWVTAAWRESRRVLASTLAGIGDAVMATDKDGRITFLNPVAETLTGWSGGEARHKAVDDVLRLVDEHTRQTIDNPLTRVLRDRAMVTTGERIILISRSGAEVPIEHNAAPVRGDSGELRGAILVFRDTSKRRQFEEQPTHCTKDGSRGAAGRRRGGRLQ